MTTPNSTSQSLFFEPLGSITASSGPWMHEMALVKMMGSFGIGRPASAAWSR